MQRENVLRRLGHVFVRQIHVNSFVASTAELCTTRSEQITICEKNGETERLVFCWEKRGELMKLPAATVTAALLEVVGLTGGRGIRGQGHGSTACHRPN